MEQSPAIENYMAAMRGIAAYAVKLSGNSDDGNSPERGYLLAMAGEVGHGDHAVLEESRSFLRCVLREYRDESAAYLAQLRQELAATAATLRDVSGALVEGDSQAGANFQSGLTQLRALTANPAARSSADLIRLAAAELESGLAEMRKHHQLIVSQMHTEVRLLHRRMEALTAADLDDLSRLMPRDEIEDRIAVVAPGTFCLVVLKADGLVQSKAQYAEQVFHDLLIAFTRRMRNTLPPDTPAGRWSEDGFIAIVFAGAAYARELAATLHRRLSGPYICRSEAKTVVTPLQTRVEVIETGPGESRDRVLETMDRLLTAPVSARPSHPSQP
jgi:GGDEF domain-containing protein